MTIETPSISKWGEHSGTFSHDDLRTPFEEWMRYKYSEPDLEWNDRISFYVDYETELRYQGWCEGAFFMEYYKDKN